MTRTKRRAVTSFREWSQANLHSEGRPATGLDCSKSAARIVATRACSGEVDAIVADASAHARDATRTRRAPKRSARALQAAILLDQASLRFVAQVVHQVPPAAFRFTAARFPPATPSVWPGCPLWQARFRISGPRPSSGQCPRSRFRPRRRRPLRRSARDRWEPGRSGPAHRPSA